jgi:hypothetical protein
MKDIGTVRENRTNGAAQVMKSTKNLKKSSRGEFDYRSDGKVYFCITPSSSSSQM